MPWDTTDQSFKILINKRVTSDAKKFYEEVGDDTLNVHLDNTWIAGIPANPADGITQGILQQYTLFALTEDLTVPNHQCFYAFSGTRLHDWVSDKYGTNYGIQLFANNGTPIYTTDPSQWFFNYQTGILIFNGSVAGYPLPFKISGYRYIGGKGVTGLQGVTGFGLGSPGATGVRGTTGVGGGGQGVTGIQGVQGVTGVGSGGGGSGAQGATGPVGDEGPQGIPGVTGPQGATGGNFAPIYTDGVHVGIDTTNPQSKLTIADGGFTLDFKPYGGAGPHSAILFNTPLLTIENSTPGSFPLEISSANIRIDASTNLLYMGDNGIAGFGLQTADVMSIVSGADMTVISNGGMSITTGGANPAMTMLSNGFVGLDNTNPAYNFEVGTDPGNGNNPSFYIIPSEDNDSTGFLGLTGAKASRIFCSNNNNNVDLTIDVSSAVSIHSNVNVADPNLYLKAESLSIPTNIIFQTNDGVQPLSREVAKVGPYGMITTVENWDRDFYDFTHDKTGNDATYFMTRGSSILVLDGPPSSADATLQVRAANGVGDHIILINDEAFSYYMLVNPDTTSLFTIMPGVDTAYHFICRDFDGITHQSWWSKIT
jgi:hypothetical protein